MDSMVVLFATIMGVAMLLWAIQGIRLYRSCKEDLYSDLYGNFVSYFYHYVIIRNCSESNFLRTALGMHKIVFSTVSRESGYKTRMCVIFYNRGIMVLCYDRATGEFHGNSGNRSWNVIRKDRDGVSYTYQHFNPTKDLEAYTVRLSELFPDIPIEKRIAFHNKADYSRLRSSIKMIHFSDIADELKNVQGENFSDDKIKAMYEKLIKK